LFNPEEKLVAEISIPDEWLDDPRRRSTIGEALALTIRNSSYVLPQAHSSSSRLSRAFEPRWSVVARVNVLKRSRSD
jgi:hypothetical protein